MQLFKNKSILKAILPLVLFLATFIITGFDFSQLEEAPLNPNFIRYQKYLYDHLGERNRPPRILEHFGEIPSPVDRSHLRNVALPFDRDWAPTSYDLRTLSKLTPIRNQGGCGSCWTFGTMASLESFGKPGNDWNFSEQDLNVSNGFDFGECNGGNHDMAIAYLARWSGPLEETDVPYPYGDGYTGDIIQEGFNPPKHVQQVVVIPPRSDFLDNDTIKNFVMSDGAVYVSFYYGSSYIDAADLSFYNNVNTNTNHAVAVVGWDDDYAAGNFRPDRQPPGDGAFLIRNSWGTGRHDNGYFWLSYYDTSFVPRASMNNAEDPGNYDTIYQYDPLGQISGSGYGSSVAWAANIFTASNTSILKAVSFHTNDTNTQYEIYIYKGVTLGNPTSGTLAASQTGSQIYPGYYTEVLNSPVLLNADDLFSVVIKFTNSSYTYPIAIEKVTSGYSSGAVTNPGESFMSSSGSSWTDVYNYGWNVCVKAFAVDSSIISGNVNLVTGGGLEDVLMNGLPGNPLTDSSGFYSATVPAGWSGTVTPTLAGYFFTEPSTDYTNVSTDQTTDYIADLISITVTSPNGGENWFIGSGYNITWTSAGTVGNVKIEYSTNNGQNWTEIIASTENDGIYPWTVPNTPSNQCLIRVSETDGSPVDISDNMFSIFSPTINVTSPNGGESWMATTAHNITWTTTGTVGNIKIEYSTNNGGNWTEIIGSTANDGAYPWTVPSIVSNQCLVRISETDGSPLDTSDAVFSINEFVSLTVTSPNGGENWDAGSIYDISWTSQGNVGNVQILYSVNNGESWQTITASTENDGNFNWPVPYKPSDNCLVRVFEKDSDGGPGDTSDAVFSIVANITGSLTLRSPNGGEKWLAGSSQQIKWASSGDINNVALKYSKDNGTTWKTITANTPNDGSFNWTVPDANSDDCLVQIQANGTDLDPKPSDVSDTVFSIVLGSSPALRIISPNGGEKLVVGSLFPISWKGGNTRGQVKIEYSIDNGDGWTEITPATENDGQFDWLVPDDPSDSCLIRISDTSGQPSDVCDQVFSIVTPIPSDITVTSPNGGESWPTNSSQLIKWTASGDSDNVAIDFSTDNGTTWKVVVLSTPNTGNYEWTLPQVVSDECLVRVSSADSDVEPRPSDISDQVFSITFHPNLRVVAPNGGEQLRIGSTYPIKWYFTNSRDQAKIEYSTNGGSSWNEITPATENDGQYEWLVPDTVSDICLLRINEINSPEVDLSDAVFSIVQPSTSDITVTAPNGGESWTTGSLQDIKWTDSGDSINVAIDFSTDNGTTWKVVVLSTPNTGNYEWTLPQVVSDECLVRVSSADSDVEPRPSDTSDQVFSIVQNSGVFRVTSPNGGESWEVDTMQAITWSSTGNINSVMIEYSIDNGQAWDMIASAVSNTGSYNWRVPVTVSDQCLVKVTAADGDDDSNPTDVSDSVFSIVLPQSPTIRVITPDGGEQLVIGSTYQITWFSTNSREPKKIEYSSNGGESWEEIVAAIEDTGGYDWLVPDEPSDTCLVRISEVDGDPVDISNAVFSIVQPLGGDLTVLTPNGGENLNAGDQFNISWTSSGFNNVILEYSVNNGATWLYIDNVPADNGSYPWTVPATPSDACLVRISGADSDENPVDISDGVFTILDSSQKSLEVFTPNGGDSLSVGSEYYITWGSEGLISVTIEYSTDNGDTWQPIATVPAARGRHTWVVPNDPSPDCLVRISEENGDLQDISDAMFSIIGN